ncbi:MAG: NTP transferase domain-containing protein [Gemmatimonadaceae bacterium]
MPRGAATGERARPAIAGVVLAAGASRRFGELARQHKLLAPLGGKPLVRWAVEGMLASPVTRTLVVVGGEAAAVEGALGGLRVRFVLNEAYQAGMSTSLHAAVHALTADGGGVRAAVFALGDQPFVPSAVVERLVHTFRATGAPVVVPVYAGGERGHPVLFASNLFPELLAVRGDEGARGVIARDRSRVTTVQFDFPAPRDVDLPGDLEALRADV